MGEKNQEITSMLILGLSVVFNTVDHGFLFAIRNKPLVSRRRLYNGLTIT